MNGHGHELDSSDSDGDIPDQRRPFGFERLTGWSPEPTPKEPEDFLDQLLADGVPDQTDLWFIPQPPTQSPMEPQIEPRVTQG